jgi:hypothetical protein
MHPERLMAQQAFLSQHEEIVRVASQVELFPGESIQAGYSDYVRWQNGVLAPESIVANMCVESPFAHSSVTFRRAAIEQIGGCRDGPFPEDYDRWLRMYHAGYRMAKLPLVLLQWRERPDRASRVLVYVTTLGAG